MNYYVHTNNDEEYEISNKAYDFIKELKKDYKVNVYGEYSFSLQVYLKIIISKNDKQYKLSLLDFTKENVLLLIKCEAVHLNIKFNKEGYLVDNIMTDKGFILSYLNENEDENDCFEKIVDDDFPSYLVDKFPYLTIAKIK